MCTDSAPTRSPPVGNDVKRRTNPEGAVRRHRRSWSIRRRSGGVEQRERVRSGASRPEEGRINRACDGGTRTPTDARRPPSPPILEPRSGESVAATGTNSSCGLGRAVRAATSSGHVLPSPFYPHSYPHLFCSLSPPSSHRFFFSL